LIGNEWIEGRSAPQTLGSTQICMPVLVWRVWDKAKCRPDADERKGQANPEADDQCNAEIARDAL
jgi:hypothetical protein